MTSEQIRQKAREAFEKFWISTNNSNFFADRQISITDLKTVAFESWIMATAFGESLLSGGADSGTPAEATPDNYVAWCRYIRTGDFARIETCDSDAPGAFKVYRGAAPPAASPQPLLERIPNAGDQFPHGLYRAASGGQPAATKTERGFDRIDFQDHYGIACSLQKSSLATEDAIWLGCNDAEPKQLIRGEGWAPVAMPAEYIANTRMHLTREQVAELLPYLQRFVETGEICERAASGSGTPATQAYDMSRIAPQYCETHKVVHKCELMLGTPATPSTQPQPKCNCGAGDGAYLATHALDCSLRKWAMSPQTVMPTKIFDPKELAGRIAKRVFDEDWKCIEAEKTELLSLDELRTIIEQELTR